MQKRRRLGTWAVALSYVFWGTLTIFWNLLSEVDSVYILSQRILWSMVFMGIYIAVSGGLREAFPIFRSGRKLGLCFLCGILITINWGVYIFAVTTGHVLDASLGYFLEPVLVAVIGMVCFRERPSRSEKITFGFAVAALLYMMAVSGTFPVLSVLIAGSFAVYGAVKKKLDISPQVSLFMETLCMTPFALIFVLYAEGHGTGGLGILQGTELLLLPACGIVTSVPLLLFNIGVKEIPYYISGILMYINPTLQFLMGLCYFREELDRTRLYAFVLIWAGILFTVWEKVRIMRAEAQNTEAQEAAMRSRKQVKSEPD